MYMSLELLQPAALCTESEAEVGVTLMVKKVFQPERSGIARSLSAQVVSQQEVGAWWRRDGRVLA